MTGATENYKHRGVIPRAISQVYKDIAEQPQMAITVRVSFLEIYNETMVDLLNPSSNTKDDISGLTVVDDKSGKKTFFTYYTCNYSLFFDAWSCDAILTWYDVIWNSARVLQWWISANFCNMILQHDIVNSRIS